MLDKKNPPEGNVQMQFPTDNLSLAEHIELLGIDVPWLSHMSQVPTKVIERALQGGHITEYQAKKLGEALAHKHGADGTIAPEHIRDLNVWKLPAKHEKML